MQLQSVLKAFAATSQFCQMTAIFFPYEMTKIISALFFFLIFAPFFASRKTYDKGIQFCSSQSNTTFKAQKEEHFKGDNDTFLMFYKCLLFFCRRRRIKSVARRSADGARQNEAQSKSYKSIHFVGQPLGIPVQHLSISSKTSSSFSSKNLKRSKKKKKRVGALEHNRKWLWGILFALWWPTAAAVPL